MGAYGLPSCRAILDEALAAPNGAKLTFPDRASMTQTYKNLHRIRSQMRKATADAAGGIALTSDGTSPYDALRWQASTTAPWTIIITQSSGDLLRELDIKLEIF